jgi:hypothetical protein
MKWLKCRVEMGFGSVRFIICIFHIMKKMGEIIWKLEWETN